MTHLERREEYHQASFQRNRSEGVATDHAHKYSKVVRAGLRRGPVFEASYTNMSLLGPLDLARLCMSKSMGELDQLIGDYAESRRLCNDPRVKVHFSDHLPGDGAVWRKHFKDDLQNDIANIPRSDTDLPRLDIDENNVEYLATVRDMDRVARAFLSKYSSNNGKVVFGFDAEWNRGETGIRIFVVSFPNEEIKLFDLNAAGIFDESNFPPSVKSLLEKEHLIPTGVNVGGDCGRMRTFGVRMTRWYELIDMAKLIKPLMESYGMKHLVPEFLAAAIDKHGQHGDYSVSPLPQNLQQYAAIDGAVSRVLYQVFRKQLSALEVETVLQEPTSLVEHQTYDLVLGGEKVAKVKMIHCGKKSRKGEVIKWGTTTLIQGKAIIQIEEVLFPTIMPPFSYTAHKDDLRDRSWNKKDRTIQQLFECNVNILVNTSSLLQTISIVTDDCSALADSLLRTTTNNTNEVDGNEGARPEDGSSDEVPDDPLLYYCDNFDELEMDEEESRTRNRQKHDLFHQFQNLPMGKKVELRHIVSRLLIHATFIFNNEDFERVANHVSKFIKVPKSNHVEYGSLLP